MDKISLQSQIEAANRQLAQLKAQCNKITGYIKRLEEALPKLQICYDEFFGIKYTTVVYEDDIPTWRGNNFNKFLSSVNDGLGMDLDVYTSMYYNNVITPISDKIGVLYTELETLEDQCNTLTSNINCYKNQLEFEKLRETMENESHKNNSSDEHIRGIKSSSSYANSYQVNTHYGKKHNR